MNAAVLILGAFAFVVFMASCIGLAILAWGLNRVDHHEYE